MNEKEFLNSQKAAVERMREMNSRSRFGGNNSDNSLPAPPVKAVGKDNQNQHQNQQKTAPIPINNNTQKGHNNSLFAGLDIPFLDKIMKDSDTVIIIGLLLILMSENADKRLLFALIYILL